MSDRSEIQEVMDKLALLEPTSDEQPADTHVALTAVQHRIQQQENQPVADTLEYWLQRTRRIFSMNMRRIAYAGAFVALLAVVFSFPATRTLASDFLGLFRVQKFAPISVSPEQIALLQELGEEGITPGEFELESEPEAVTVASLAEAEAEVGYWVRTLGSLGQPTEIGVTYGTNGNLNVNLEGARAILEAAQIDPALLPDELDGADISATLHPSVMQMWEEEGVVFMQTPSPEIDYPESFNPAPIGQAVLQLLGMEEGDAARMAETIDWTNTLIVPIPQEMATFQEVFVDGMTGLAIVPLDGSGATVTWQAYGNVFFVGSEELGVEELLDLIELD